ncbi:SWIM zinc finger family protein [Streptomyces canus]|uniref:SWIM zinc finger family protein n=1 Tax=Streptomyces canus TaxID=58343 RepID=UPI002781C77C|nr:SWIM zinc finger family protein [Streptomyces canus]MDQ0764946.1 putative Zn finger protein [Streptomyces canus]
MTPGPADEARRALRAARERASREGTGDAGGQTVTGADGGQAQEAGSSAAQGTGGLAAEAVGSSAVRGGGGPEGERAGGPAAKDAGGFVAEGANRSTAESTAHRAHAEADEPKTPGGQDTERAAPENAVPDPAPSESRPGDAARAALRGAVAARRAPSAGTDVDSGRFDTGAPSAASADSPGGETHQVVEPAPPAPAVDDATAGSPEARPADAAREALRAARKRRAAAATAEAALAGRSRRTAPAASRDRSPAPRPAAGARARDVRELLADAFRMPDDVALPGEDPEDPEDNDGTRQGSSVPRPSAADDSSPSTGNRAGSAPSSPLGGASARPDTNSPPLPGETPTDTGADKNRLLPAPASSTTQASPHRPHSMAAPNRDNDLRRTFPAFPPRTSEDARFAATWWGNAWVSALEEGALDAKRLARGRSYAEQGHVDAITVTPGLVLAYVQGSRPRPYRVQVRLRTLGDADWDRFLDLAADRTGHIAALLDKEMPQALAECGVPLLPGPGDLEPQCSCPDRGHPCKHAAALCYQTARLLDADPFVLLLLRGRGERELLDALSRLSAARAARAAQEQEPAPLPGVRASEALAPRRLPPLPAPLPAPAHPEQPPAYPASPGGPDPFALDQLATDAAARAHALLGTGRDPVGELTLWQDAVRLAAARPGSGLTAGTRALYASLAAATDRTPADLARAVAAWRQGGIEGLAVLEEPWDPPAGRFDRARPLLLAADLPAFRPWHNHLTHPRGHIQLRLGRDGLWYAYESEPGHDDWWPRGTPDLDPVGALTGLGTPTDL